MGELSVLSGTLAFENAEAIPTSALTLYSGATFSPNGSFSLGDGGF